MIQKQRFNDEEFTFETLKVNSHGKEIERETKSARHFTEDLGNGISLDLVYIPGGTFMMGTEKEEIERLTKRFGDYFKYESPQHEVTIQPFYMGKYPITQGQWKAIAERTDLKVNEDLDPQPSDYKDNPESFSFPSTRGNLDLPAYGTNSTRWHRPVEQVNWYQAKEFCARLSKLTGKEYRLPSEAQWEYACRADPPKSPLEKGTSDSPTFQGGARGGFPFYFGETITSDLANYYGGNIYADEQKGVYRGETTPVGMFPNAFGLYDMHGNVWEWCEDDWHDNYQGASNDGSVWKSVSSKYVIFRGGSFVSDPSDCRSAYRNDGLARGSIHRLVGFRVVCVLPRTY